MWLGITQESQVIIPCGPDSNIYDIYIKSFTYALHTNKIITNEICKILNMVMDPGEKSYELIRSSINRACSTQCLSIMHHKLNNICISDT